MSNIKLRPEVRRFAEHMEIELRANESKGGWHDCDPFWLLGRIEDERRELREAMISNISVNNGPCIQRVISEAADVANFAMMIADLTYRYGITAAPAAETGGAK